MARVLIVDTNPEDRFGIGRALRDAGHDVVRACNAASALALAGNGGVDAVITEWLLADSSALDLAASLRAIPECAATRILVASQHGESRDVARALDNGIDDYLLKAARPDELIARVNAALRRPPAANGGNVLQVGAVTLDRVAHRIAVKGHTLNLAPAEFRLMAYFIEHPGRVFSRRQLLAHVWNRRKGIGERTVDVHVRRLRAALAPSGCDNLLQTIRGFGYRFG